MRYQTLHLKLRQGIR